ncbi:uncharacterized protein LOC131949386 isoform X2 [Physella acuta]|uniref:uncharacterized protein LOC131949386 isoform X2 n=1 Tax=Physella acuta TaxID=109671 RepID=UPI0027DB95CF|nr:uncharacterized protein LOC131949386 isoform X2 [Physella acuta]XP_059167237.1 uncharacterized protein LOC131949386 isoform X2 [Physella acuta]
MYFKLIKPEGSKLGSMTIAAIVCPIVLVLLLIILVLSVMVWRKRETSDDKAGIVKPEVLLQQCHVIQRFAVDGDGYLMSRDCVPDTQSLGQPPTDQLDQSPTDQLDQSPTDQLDQSPTDQLDTGDHSKLETRLDENVYSTIDDTHDDYVNAGVSSPQHSAADRTIESSDAVSRCLMLDDRRDAQACCTTNHYTNLCHTTNIDDRPYASSDNAYFVPI